MTEARVRLRRPERVKSGAPSLRSQGPLPLGTQATRSNMMGMGRADLQIHSDVGDGLGSPAEILDAAERVGLDVIALTDHDDIRGSFQLRDLAARHSSPVQVVTGIEVTTRSGHLLALFVEDEIQMLRPLAETVQTIHGAGGLAVVPHPLSYLTFSIGERALRSLAATDDAMVDAIEAINPSYAGRVRARKAAWLNEHVLRVAETGSSDAHHPALVGTAWTEFAGRTPEDLRRAIRERTTAARGRHWTLREHLDGSIRQQWRAMLRDPAKRAWREARRLAVRGGKGALRARAAPAPANHPRGGRGALRATGAPAPAKDKSGRGEAPATSRSRTK